MKNLKTLALTGFAFFTQLQYAQQSTSVNIDKNMATQGAMFTKTADKADTVGTQYYNPNFLPAKIGEGSVTLIRYNAYNDQIEFQNGDKVQGLPAEKGKTITTIDGKTSYTYTDYTTDQGESYTGYLISVASYPALKIYARQKMLYQPESEPSNGYESTRPATYKKTALKYYIGIKDNPIVYLSPKKKELIKLFPGKEAQISEYAKNNKISDKDEDMVKLADFLSTL